MGENYPGRLWFFILFRASWHSKVCCAKCTHWSPQLQTSPSVSKRQFFFRNKYVFVLSMIPNGMGHLGQLHLSSAFVYTPGIHKNVRVCVCETCHTRLHKCLKTLRYWFGAFKLLFLLVPYSRVASLGQVILYTIRIEI